MKGQIACTNCAVHHDGNFCPSCGQKRFSRKQFEFGSALRDIMAEVFDLESALGKTIKKLVFSPGTLTADFLNGKQKAYVGPVKLYLIVITINFLVYSYLEHYSLVNIEFLRSIRDAIPLLQEMVPDIVGGNKSSADYLHRINQRINDILPFLLYLLIFLHGLVLKIQFHSSRRYYMEHLVFSLHFMTFGFLRDTVILPVQLASRQAGFMVTIATTAAYLFFAIGRCYGKTRMESLFHTIVHYSIFFFLFFMTVLLSILLALWSV